MPNKPNVIALTADAAMFPAAAFLATRLAALNPRPHDTEVVIYSDSVVDLQKAIAFRVPADLQYVESASARLPKYAADRLSPIAFLRLFVPALLGDEVKRILYMDVDVSVENASPFALFDLDMKGYAIAGVRDICIVYDGTSDGASEMRLAGFTSQKYVQSGVLLIDRAAYLTHDLRTKIFAAATDGHLHDQAAINVVLRGDWLELSPAMNMQTQVANSFGHGPRAIIHFWGKTKPWHPTFGEHHPIRSEMLAYFKASPWPTFGLGRIDLLAAIDATRLSKKLPTFAAVVKPGRPIPRAFLPATSDVAGIASYLRKTKFADVEAGITTALSPTPRPVPPAASP